MNDSNFEQLVEKSWRGPLTPAEEAELQAWLAAHPEDVERWEAESGVNRALAGLASVAPSSNFTSRVLEMVELEQRAAARRPALGLGERLRRFWGVRGLRLAWSLLLVLGIGGLGYRQYQEHDQSLVAQGMQSVSAMAAVTPVEALEDFDAIREFSQFRPEIDQTDEALYALLGN